MCIHDCDDEEYVIVESVKQEEVEDEEINMRLQRISIRKDTASKALVGFLNCAVELSGHSLSLMKDITRIAIDISSIGMTYANRYANSGE